MGGSKKMSTQKRALVLLALLILSLWGACTELSQKHYRTGSQLLLIVFGILIWLVMTQVSSRCGVLNTNGKTYCRNRIRGLLFGCHQHTWQRPLAFIGIGNKPAPPRRPASTPPRTTEVRAASGAIPVLTGDEREHRRGAILFYVSIGSLTMGSLSTLTDVFGFIKEVT